MEKDMELLLIIGLVIGWFVVNMWLLPRAGVAT
jgi:hypothetical protein